jgi:hypothetical protein
MIQNGAPDAVALIDTATGARIDALAYEGTMATLTLSDSTAITNPESTTLADSNAVAASLARVTDGCDRDMPAMDWELSAGPSPGLANP